MSDPNIVRRMTAYMAWADDVMLKNAEALPDAELMASRDALFGSISGTFDHILVVCEIFQAHLEGRTHPHTARYRDAVLPFAEVAARLRAIDGYYVACAERWDSRDLAEVIDFEFVGGGRGAMSRADILLHLTNHATYHRGFISALMHPLRPRMASNDLTVFLRDAWSETSHSGKEIEK